jgi:hypothetical protein
MSDPVALAFISSLPATIAAVGAVAALLQGKQNAAKADAIAARAEEIHASTKASVEKLAAVIVPPPPPA